MNGHTPTRRQKDYLDEHGYLADSWLVLKDTKEQMVIKNRKCGRTATISKEEPHD